MSGTAWLNWSGVATLEHGRQYGICVTGEYSLPNDSLYFPDGPNSCSNGTNEGKRSYTTIDRSKPSTSVAVAGGADFTKQQTIPLSIGFQDDVAGPHPANFVCVKAGADPCQGGFAYLPECSVPGGGGKSTTFGCGVDASQLPDGPVTVCAIAADAAVPDNPSSADQTRSRQPGEPLGCEARHGRPRSAGADAGAERVEDTRSNRRVRGLLGRHEQLRLRPRLEHAQLGVRRRYAGERGRCSEPLVRSARHVRDHVPREGSGRQRSSRGPRSPSRWRRRRAAAAPPHQAAAPPPEPPVTCDPGKLPGVQIGAVRVHRAEERPAREEGQAAPYSAPKPTRRAR